MAIIEKATKARYYLLFGFLTFIIIILAITLHHYIQKKRMLDTIFQKENKIKESMLFIQMKEKEIEEEKKLIIQKEKDLESICIAKSKLAKQLEEAENDFKMLIAQNRPNMARFALFAVLPRVTSKLLKAAKPGPRM